MKKNIYTWLLTIFLISIMTLEPAGMLNAHASGFESNLNAITVPTPNTPTGIIIDRTPKYTWTKVSNATNYQYELYRGTTRVYTKTVGTLICGTTTCAHTPTNLLGFNTFKWHVRAKVGGVWKAWSAWKYFTVRNPMVPVPQTPKGAIYDRTPTYKWLKVTKATNYQYQLYKGTTFIYTKTLGTAGCGTIACVHTPTNLLGYATTYKWRVRAKVGGIWRPWSAWKFFALNKPNIAMPQSPQGTIGDTTPTYKWTKAKDVQNYQLQLYKNLTPIYTITYGPACGVSICVRTPSKVLSAGNYKWRVRVQKGGFWKPWSAWKTFTIPLPTEFDFNTTHPGWTSYGGIWVHENSQYYTSVGFADKWANIGYDAQSFSTQTYEVRMMRTTDGVGNYPNRIIIRGVPSSSSPYEWTKGYSFQYSNLPNGKYSVYKLDGGSGTVLLDWTLPDDPVVVDGWNTIKVVANGSSLKFYINNNLVWEGTDTTYSSGKVGIGFIRPTGTNEKLLVDWANISTSITANILADEYVMPGTVIPGGSITSAPE